MSKTRQLAAIMFTDIVGYTALMGTDEQKAFNILSKNRQLQKPLIEQLGGRWVKELGDGVLASFSNATDAVLCAIAIQQACADDPDLQLRVGIHTGDVVFEDNDVFGDSVNIAARLQTLAPVGGILISEQVYKNVVNNRYISTRLVGDEILKNVKEPVRVYEVNLTPTEDNSIRLKGDAAKGFSKKSIAVLPFVNMSNDPEQEYFSDGIAEEITNSLAHLKDLKVAGRTSSSQYKGAKVDLREIGEKLGVAHVLEGSVRKQGNKLRVTAQLINVKDGFHIWSEKYDRNMDDIFAIQDDIALAITEQLKVRLLGKDRELVTKTNTQNAEAYEMYLKGMFHINRRGSSILTGLKFFEQAIAIDPKYALAYTGYADANFLGAFYGFFSGREVMAKVKKAVETAIALDNSRCESYCTLAQYYIGLDWNWKEAEKNYLKSIELNPRFAQTRALYGMAYLAFNKGDFDEAEKQGRLAVKLEPLSAIVYADLSWTLYTAQKFEEALAVAQAGVEIDTNSFLSQRLAGLNYWALKRFEEAIDTFNYLIKISNRHQQALNDLIWVHCSMGNLKEAEILMHELETKAKSEYIAGTHMGLSAAWLGDVEKAFVYLERAFYDHDPILITIKRGPNIPDLLRDDPRFQKLLDRLASHE
jgi:TolB-like protein/class 3 adenylate cyclase/Tfp pilus assembly protein PilF